MTDQRTGAAPYAGSTSTSTHRSGWNPAGSSWVGWLVFASVMMTMVGFSHLVQGLVAIFDDTYYLVTDSGLTVAADYTVWGWTHLVAGSVVMVAGLSLFSGHTWARVVAIVFTAVSALLSFGFMAAYPAWSALVIALDVCVILALTVHGDD
jgi:hypothetical protein